MHLVGFIIRILTLYLVSYNHNQSTHHRGSDNTDGRRHSLGYFVQKLCGKIFGSYSGGDRPHNLYEAESFLRRQQSFRLVKFWTLYKTPKICYLFSKSIAMVSILSQVNPFPFLASCFFKSSFILFSLCIRLQSNHVPLRLRLIF